VRRKEEPADAPNRLEPIGRETFSQHKKPGTGIISRFLAVRRKRSGH
jgi:hypothetical protein